MDCHRRPMTPISSSSIPATFVRKPPKRSIPKSASFGASNHGAAAAVAGCVAQAEGEEILKRAPAVDLVMGPQIYHRLPELLERLARDGEPIVATEFPLEDKFDHLAAPSPEATRKRGVSAFLTVQEG